MVVNMVLDVFHALCCALCLLCRTSCPLYSMERCENHIVVVLQQVQAKQAGRSTVDLRCM